MKRDAGVTAVFLLRKNTAFTPASLFIFGGRMNVTLFANVRLENEIIKSFYHMHISIPITMILPVLSIDWHIGKIVNWRHDKQVHVFSHFVSPCYALRIELGIHFFHWRTKYFDATLQTLFIYQIWWEDKGSMIFDHELYSRCQKVNTKIIKVVKLNFVQIVLEK